MFSNTKKALLCIGIALVICVSLTGCDREAPVITGIDSVIELDCGIKFNLEDYLNENANITDETDDGSAQYKLSELEHTIKCNGDVYNVETGEFNTEQFGNYDVELSVKDKSNNNTTFAFTIKLNPLHMNSSLEEVVEMDCGAIFNVNDYFSENIKIVNLAESAEYKLDDFDCTINCDETIYNSASGKLDTGKFGEYNATLTFNCNGVQREHNKKLNNGLPILHKVPPKRDYGRYFCIMAEKGGTSHGGLTEKLSPFFHAKKQEVNAYGR